MILFVMIDLWSMIFVIVLAFILAVKDFKIKFVLFFRHNAIVHLIDYSTVST